MDTSGFENLHRLFETENKNEGKNNFFSGGFEKVNTALLIFPTLEGAYSHYLWKKDTGIFSYEEVEAEWAKYKTKLHSIFLEMLELRFENNVVYLFLNRKYCEEVRKNLKTSSFYEGQNYSGRGDLVGG